MIKITCPKCNYKGAVDERKIPEDDRVIVNCQKCNAAYDEIVTCPQCTFVFRIQICPFCQQPQADAKKKSSLREYVEAIVTAVLLAVAIRSFAIEAFKIPSSSMVPTLLVGDHIFVNKFIYGFRLPMTKQWITHFRTPQRGEVIVFIYPKDESKDYIKRVIGLPGDKVRTVGQDVYVNGELLPKEKIAIDDVPPKDRGHFDYFMEMVDGVRHFVQHEKEYVRDGGEYTVPAGHLFAMGDNRDGSADSRDWGFVPVENLKGKAMFIWLSWDAPTCALAQCPLEYLQFWKHIRGHRFGRWIH